MRKVLKLPEDWFNEVIPDGLCKGQYRMIKVGNALFDALKDAGLNPLYRLKEGDPPHRFSGIEIDLRG